MSAVIPSSDRIPEIEWALDAGLEPWEIAVAFKVKRKSLARQLLRDGRADLARLFHSDTIERRGVA